MAFTSFTFYQRVYSVTLLLTILTGLYFYSNSHIEIKKKITETRKESLVELGLRPQAPQWLHTFHFTSKVTYVNYWSYLCVPCLNELPFLTELQAQGRSHNQFQVLLFNVDQNNEVTQQAQNHFTKEFPQSKSIYGHQPAFNQFKQVGALPYHQIIDQNGKLAFEFIGEIKPLTQNKIKDYIQKLNEEKAPSP